MGKHTYYELSRRSIKVNKNEAVSIIKNNSYLTVRTYKGINLYDFSYNLKCTDKKIDWIESFMAVPKHSPTSHLFDEQLMKSGIKNAQLTEMIINSSFWPHNLQLVEEMTFISGFQWSPPMFFRTEGLLAILNSIGGIVLAIQEDFKWIYILNLAPYVSQSIGHNSSPRTFQELKQSVYSLASTAICWAKQINPDKSCYLITAQRNGNILIWRIEKDLTKINIVTSLKTDTCDIESLIWIPITPECFWLICANVVGQIFAYKCEIQKGEIVLLTSNTLWNCKDRMVANNLNYTAIGKNVLLIFAKHRHLVVLALDENCKVVSQYLNNINDYRITSIVDSIDGFYVATVNMNIYKMDVVYSNSKLTIVCNSLEIKDSYPNHEIYSLCFSNNNMLLTLALVDRKVLIRKESLSVEIVFMSTQDKLESIVPVLLASESLTYHWDCIEALRYICIKQKAVPVMDYSELYTLANKDVHKLKIYLIIAIIYNNLKHSMVRYDSNLPEKSEEVIREKIMLHHAVTLIKKLYEKRKTKGVLNEFETESFGGAKRYLEYYTSKYQEQLPETIDTNILNAVNSKFKYECQSCDDLLTDGALSCSEEHLNMFCSQSFTPITTDDYLFCKCCNFTARSECGRISLCVFCDLYLVDFYNCN